MSAGYGFQDKVALVTGGSSGLGEATAKKLAALGASVVVSDIDDDGGARVVREIEADGGRAAYVHADVTQEADADALVAFAVETFGGLHAAFNNAGTAQEFTKTHEMSAERFDSVFALNARGTFLTMRAELRHFIANGGGTIVNTASGAGLKSVLGMPAYVGSKHAVVGLTRNAAIEYVGDGVRVNAIAPGTIATPMITTMAQDQQDLYASVIPMGRLGRPEEVADLVAFLLGDESTFITGDVVEIDGGYMQK